MSAASFPIRRVRTTWGLLNSMRPGVDDRLEIVSLRRGLPRTASRPPLRCGCQRRGRVRWLFPEVMAYDAYENAPRAPLLIGHFACSNPQRQILHLASTTRTDSMGRWPAYGNRPCHRIRNTSVPPESSVPDRDHHQCQRAPSRGADRGSHSVTSINDRESVHKNTTRNNLIHGIEQYAHHGQTRRKRPLLERSAVV